MKFTAFLLFLSLIAAVNSKCDVSGCKRFLKTCLDFTCHYSDGQEEKCSSCMKNGYEGDDEALHGQCKADMPEFAPCIDLAKMYKKFTDQSLSDCVEYLLELNEHWINPCQIFGFVDKDRLMKVVRSSEALEHAMENNEVLKKFPEPTQKCGREFMDAIMPMKKCFHGGAMDFLRNLCRLLNHHGGDDTDVDNCLKCVDHIDTKLDHHYKKKE